MRYAARDAEIRMFKPGSGGGSLHDSTNVQKLAGVPELADFLALLRVGEPAGPGAEILLHVLGIVCRRDHAGDRGLGKYIFEEQLCPARAIEFARPVLPRIAT